MPPCRPSLSSLGRMIEGMNLPSESIERREVERKRHPADAPFHDTVPWGTTEFLDLYPELTSWPEEGEDSGRTEAEATS